MDFITYEEIEALSRNEEVPTLHLHSFTSADLAASRAAHAELWAASGIIFTWDEDEA